MQLNHRTSARRAPALLLALAIAALLLLLPSGALAQPVPTGAPTGAPTGTAQATAAAAPALTLSSSKDPVGTSITANGSGFRANETVDVTFNGTPVGSPV